jgi:hypothetical protein
MEHLLSFIFRREALKRDWNSGGIGRSSWAVTFHVEVRGGFASVTHDYPIPTE